MAKSSAPKTVTLLDPNGREFQATHPAEVTNLVFGSGYRLKDGKKTVDQAVADLADTAPVSAAATTQTGTTNTGSGSSSSS